MNKFIIYCFLVFTFQLSFSQIDSLKVLIKAEDCPKFVDTLQTIVNDSIDQTPIDISNFEPFNNVILNEKSLDSIFEKLYQLELKKDRKVRILHIGDSHIQADFFTGKMRNRLEGVFGNGGFGFTFPYNLAHTNNSSPIKYSGSGGFSTTRNLFADSSKPIGLSGIALESNSSNMHINLKVKDSKYNFKKIKILSPNNQNIFDIATTVETIVTKAETPQTVSHVVLPGEFLGKIAKKYKVSLKSLKKANGLKSDIIKDGISLIIPKKKVKVNDIYKSQYVPIDLKPENSCHVYESNTDLTEINILSDKEANGVILNGIIIENENPGVTYSAIGVNGAKYTDYSKFNLFFEQLTATEADFVILSFGTNESYDNQDQEKFYNNMKSMVDGIKNKLPNASLLITTPPPSVHRNKQPNGFVELYKDVIVNHSIQENYAVWDLLNVFGGVKNVYLNSRMGLMAKDKVHYSTLGYEKQGELFFDAFIQSYELYKSKKQ